jgi:hypothetical protein
MVIRFSPPWLIYTIAAAVTGWFALAAGTANAAEIRFYKVNSKGQQSEVGFLRNRDKPGCHNTLGGRDVFRVAQIGFTYCEVYSEKDCEADSALIMNWKGPVKPNSARAQPTERLMPGDMWYFDENEPLEINSWKCQP